MNAAAFGTVLTYFMVVLSFVFLRKNMPNLERPYRVPAAKFIGTLAVLISKMCIRDSLKLQHVQDPFFQQL